MGHNLSGGIFWGAGGGGAVCWAQTPAGLQNHRPPPEKTAEKQRGGGVTKTGRKKCLSPKIALVRAGAARSGAPSARCPPRPAPSLPDPARPRSLLLFFFFFSFPSLSLFFFF